MKILKDAVFIALVVASVVLIVCISIISNYLGGINDRLDTMDKRFDNITRQFNCRCGYSATMPFQGKAKCPKCGTVEIANGSEVLTLMPKIEVTTKPGGPISNPATQPGSDHEWETARFRVTAYCPCEKCCGKWAKYPLETRRTAAGAKLSEITACVAADPSIPFGTWMRIPGYAMGKPVQVLDRGGAIKGSRLDLLFATHQQALEWGVRDIEVKVLKKNN